MSSDECRKASINGVGVCEMRAGNLSRTWLCFGPGPGLGHQNMHVLGSALNAAGIGAVLVEYPGPNEQHSGPTAASDWLGSCRDTAVLGFEAIVGVSWGCEVAVGVATPATPILVLIAPAFLQDPRAFSGLSAPGLRTGSVLQASRQGKESWLRQIVTVGADEESVRHVEKYEVSFEHWMSGRRLSRVLPDARSRLNSDLLDVPKYLIFGEWDPLVHPSGSNLAGLEHVSVATVPGGHFPYLGGNADLVSLFSSIQES